MFAQSILDWVDGKNISGSSLSFPKLSRKGACLIHLCSKSVSTSHAAAPTSLEWASCHGAPSAGRGAGRRGGSSSADSHGGRESRDVDRGK